MTTSTTSPTGVSAGTRRVRRTPHPSVVLGVILVTQLMVVLDATIVNIALADIKTALDFNTADLSWVLNAYTLTFGGLLLLGARAGDLLGRRRTFLFGTALFTAASFAGGFAQNGSELLAARALQGVGGAFASPAALALLMVTFAGAQERVRALGLYTAVSVGGAGLGLLAGGMLTQWASWRWVFFVNVPIGIALFVAARLVLTETPRRRGTFDLAGALSSTLGMTALVYGFVRAATAGWSDPYSIGAFTLGVVSLAAFIAAERTATAPITPLRLFADRNRAISYLARLLLMAGMFGMFFFLTQYFQDVLGYSALRTGLSFLPMPLTVFAASQLSARVLVHRIDPRRMITGGLLLSTIGLALLTRVTETSGYPAVLVPLLLFALGNGLAFVPLTGASLAGVAPEDAGAASGLVNVTQQVGGSLGLAVLVTVFGTASKHATAPLGADAAEVTRHAFSVGAHAGYLVSAATLAATVLLVAFGMRSAPRRASAGPEVEEELVLSEA